MTAPGVLGVVAAMTAGAAVTMRPVRGVGARLPGTGAASLVLGAGAASTPGVAVDMWPVHGAASRQLGAESASFGAFAGVGVDGAGAVRTCRLAPSVSGGVVG